MRSRIKILFLIILPVAAHASILRVPSEYTNIQLAITAAQPRDTVLLESGTYRESVTVPARGLTIASNFLISRDTSDIDQCIWRGYMDGTDSLRCLTVDGEDGSERFIRLHGIRFAEGISSYLEEGGACYLRRIEASIEHCRFDSCVARRGGAVAGDESIIRFVNCAFTYCADFLSASVLYLTNSQALIDTCKISHSRSLQSIENLPGMISLSGSKLLINATEIRSNGLLHNWLGVVLVSAVVSADTLEIANCIFENNRLAHLLTGQSIRHFRLDSNRFSDNALSQSLYSQGGDSLRGLQIIGNAFESFTPVEGAQMHGPFAFVAPDSFSPEANVTVQRNLIHDVHGGHVSFCSMFFNSFGDRLISRNYILENSNHSITWPPSGQVLTIGSGEGEFEENVLMDNQGYAVYQGPVAEISFARHNYFGHETGPYDSLNNPGGQGDTIEWRVVYQPWATDSSFMSAVPEPQEPVAIPASFIGNAYPNPFNSTVTIEFVLLKDQEIKLDIFDLTGRQVHELFSGRMNRGVHIREWRPNGQASGIYFARLSTAEGVRSTSKLMYLK